MVAIVMRDMASVSAGRYQMGLDQFKLTYVMA